MRILLLTQLLSYPSDTGAKIKTFNMLQALATHHTIIYCSFIRSKNERVYTEKLSPYCEHIVTVLLQRTWWNELVALWRSVQKQEPFLLCRDFRMHMSKLVYRLVTEYHIDTIHVDQLNMAQYVPLNWSGKVILDEHNAVWHLLQRIHDTSHSQVKRWFLRREIQLLRRYEANACQNAHLVLAVSEQDKASIQAITRKSAPIHVVPIMINCQSLNEVRQGRKPEERRPGELHRR